jgi:large subunit ribosomal protein L17
MRHLKSGRKFGRETAHRKAMYRNLVTSLMVHGRIHTTEEKAKEIRRFAERVITLGKRVTPTQLASAEGDEAKVLAAQRIHAIRQARKWVLDRDALNRVFNEYSERFKDRPGGYTRVLKTGPRPGDNADMAYIELVTEALAD